MKLKYTTTTTKENKQIDMAQILFRKLNGFFLLILNEQKNFERKKN